MSKEITIDANNKVLGRLATKIAEILQGKNDPSYNPRLPGNTVVIIKNVEGIELTGKKAEQKVYYRHSTQPGKLKTQDFEDLFEKSPEKVLQLAVKRMLPDNRLRKDRLKRMRFVNGDQ